MHFYFYNINGFRSMIENFQSLVKKCKNFTKLWKFSIIDLKPFDTKIYFIILKNLKYIMNLTKFTHF